VSDPTYRIDTSYEPSHPDDSLPWAAHVTRLSDDKGVGVAWGGSEAVARSRACEMVRLWNTAPLPSSPIYVDDDGQPVEAHSVKA